MSKRTRPGRPSGSTTNTPHTSTATASRCVRPGCQSTEREPYFGTISHKIDGLDADGQPYNRVVFRRTRCKACGQCRIDKSFELV